MNYIKLDDIIINLDYVMYIEKKIFLNEERPFAIEIGLRDKIKDRVYYTDIDGMNKTYSDIWEKVDSLKRQQIQTNNI